MAASPTDRPLERIGKDYDNLEDYVRGFLAAVRTHQRLTGTTELEIDVEPGNDLPLAQRILLR